MVTYDAGLISVLLLCTWRKQSRQGRFSKVDNKSCHSQEDKRSNIVLNKDADASNQPVYIEIHDSDCLCTYMPDDTRKCTLHV